MHTPVWHDFRMLRARTAAVQLLVCFLVIGCGEPAGPEEVDVTPAVTTASGALRPRLEPPLPQRFVGDPKHIGFEPLPLEGGEFPLLTAFDFLPNSNEFLAVNRYGKVGHFRLEQNRAFMLDSFQIPAVFTKGDCAASSLVLDPNFSLNRLFYVGYCIDEKFSVIKRYTMSDKDFAETLYSAANVHAVGDPRAEIPQHAIGTLAFDEDLVMWVNVGDRRRENNAQDLTNELGKVIRLMPLRQTSISGFIIPEGNAFLDRDPINSLIYAVGFRDPWRGAFDTQGRYWVADAGSTNYEEINVVTRPGQNFGWPASEGPICRAGSCGVITPPVRFWDASEDHPFFLEDPLYKRNSTFRAPWVGIEYVPGVTDPYKGLLSRKMLYGDFYLGFVRGIQLDIDGRIVSDQHLGHIELPVQWRQGRDGYLYVATMLANFDTTRELEGDGNLLPQSQQGQLWRVVPLP